MSENLNVKEYLEVPEFGKCEVVKRNGNLVQVLWEKVVPCDTQGNVFSGTDFRFIDVEILSDNSVKILNKGYIICEE